MIIQLNLCDSAAAAATNWNTLIGGTTTGTKISSGSVIDSTGATALGVSVSVSDAWSVLADAGGADYISSTPSIPNSVKNSFWRLDGAGDTGDVVVSGLGAGDAIVYVFSARDAGGPRISDITVNGAETGAVDAGNDATTPGNEDYITAVTLGPSDDLAIAFVARAGSSYGHINGIIIDYTASGVGSSVPNKQHHYRRH